VYSGDSRIANINFTTGMTVSHRHFKRSYMDPNMPKRLKTLMLVWYSKNIEAFFTPAFTFKTSMLVLLYGTGYFEWKKPFYRQVLKLGANEASAQRLQNALQNECYTKFLTTLWAFENRKFVWWLYAARVYWKIQYKYFTGTYRSELESLPGKKTFF
jgi:hypothetical protein